MLYFVPREILPVLQGWRLGRDLRDLARSILLLRIWVANSVSFISIGKNLALLAGPISVGSGFPCICIVLL
jgi:hypothetical protein